METLVLDTSAIFNFGHRGQLEFLLEKMTAHTRLVTTPAVQDECGKGGHQQFYARFLQTHFTVTAAETVLLAAGEFQRLSAALDPGELTVLLVAAELKATAVIDEKLARAEAAKLGLPVMGTLGLIERAMHNQWLTDDQCLEIVLRLRAAKFRIPRPGANQTFAEYIQQIREVSFEFLVQLFAL